MQRLKRQQREPANDKEGMLISWIHIKNPQMISRLLYSNPVCILTTKDATKVNCMIISWLSCCDNAGGIIASVNKKRFSSIALQEPNAKFTLSIPTTGIEPLLLEIGSCTGAKVDKINELGLSTQRLPWEEDFPDCIHHENICAVLACEVLRIDTAGVADDGHIILFCKAKHAAVRPSHWQNNKLFVGEPNTLSFMGSKQFLRMTLPEDI